MAAAPPPAISPSSPLRAVVSAERCMLHEGRGEWPQVSFSAELDRRAATTPDRVLFVVDDERITATQVRERAIRLAAGLRALGIGLGDVVSWQLPNWIEGVYLTFALDRIGAISNPILPIYREREVAFVCAQAGSKMLIVPGIVRGFDHREMARAVAAEVGGLAQVLVARAEPLPGQGAFDSLLHGAARIETPSPLGPHDVAALFYTSGTTADPKGVMHTTSTLGAFVRISRAVTESTSESCAILWFPLTHIGGITSFGILPVVHGSRVVFLEPFDPQRGLELIEQEQVTSAGGPTPVLQAVLATPGFTAERVRSVQIAGIGAADVPPELMREVGARLGAFVYRSYGMTECPMATAGRRGDPEDRLVMTDGRASPGVTLRLVDDQGRPVPPGTEGEVELFGPQLCVGYLDPARTAEAFTADGFLRSGDLAVADADGFVRITGRKKDIIIRKGENLSAKSIEDDLHDHPKIAEAAAVGVPDRASGERVCACVVLRPGVEGLTLDEVRAFMEARGVMRQKIPEQLEIVAALPRNATGKVQKFELRRRFARAARGQGEGEGEGVGA